MYGTGTGTVHVLQPQGTVSFSARKCAPRSVGQSTQRRRAASTHRMASDFGWVAQNVRGGAGVGGGYRVATDVRYIQPTWSLMGSGVERRNNRKPRRSTPVALQAGKTKTVPGDRLRQTGNPERISESSVQCAVSPAIQRPASHGDLSRSGFVAVKLALAEAAVEEDGYPDSEPNSDVPRHMLTSSVVGNGCGHRSGYAPGGPLPRVLPDKLKWAHDTTERLWHLTDDREKSRLSAQQISILGERFSGNFTSSGARRSLSNSSSNLVGSSKLAHTQSHSTLGFAAASRISSAFAPPLERNSRSVNELYRACPDAYAFNPPAPSSLAVSQLASSSAWWPPARLRGPGLSLGSRSD